MTWDAMKQSVFYNFCVLLALVASLAGVGSAQSQNEPGMSQSSAAPFDADGLHCLLTAERQVLVDAAFRVADCETNLVERSSALIRLAQRFADAGRTNSACGALSRSQEITPLLEPDERSWRFWKSAGIYIQLDRPEDAIRSLEKAELWISNTNAVEAVGWLAKIAASYANAGDVERANEYRERVLGEVDRIEQAGTFDDYELFGVLNSLNSMCVAILQQKGDADVDPILNRMRQLAEMMPDSHGIYALALFAENYWEQGFSDTACSLLGKGHDGFMLGVTLDHMVALSTADDQIVCVVELAGLMKDENDLNRFLQTVVEYYVDRERPDLAVDMLWRMKTGGYSFIRDEASSLVAAGYADAGDFRNAVNLSKLISSSSDRAKTQAYIYSVLDAGGRGAEAADVMDFALKSAASGVEGDILCSMADVLAEQGSERKAFELLEKAYELGQEKDSAYLRASRFVDIASVYLKLGDHDTAEILLGLAQMLVEEKVEPDYKPTIIRSLAGACAKAGDVQKAVALSLSLDQDESSTCFQLRRIAENCSSAEDFSVIVEQGRVIRDDDDHCWLMDGLVERAIEIGRLDLALRVAEVCRVEEDRDDLFEDISIAFIEKKDFRRAIDSALNMDADCARFDQLTEIAKECFRQKQLGRCAEAISLITIPGEQAEALAELACLNQE